MKKGRVGRIGERAHTHFQGRKIAGRFYVDCSSGESP
jgi:hypothetical protein